MKAIANDSIVSRHPPVRSGSTPVSRFVALPLVRCSVFDGSSDWGIGVEGQ